MAREGDSVLRLTLLLPLPWLHTPGQVRIPPHSGCSCPSFEQASGHLPAAAPLTQPQHALPPSRALSGFAHTAGGDLQSCKMQVDIYIVTVERNATDACDPGPRHWVLPKQVRVQGRTGTMISSLYLR